MVGRTKNEYIEIKGARMHNLKNISCKIPKNRLVVFTGVSGSGKTSLAIDTLFAEGQRRYVESLSSYARQFLGVMVKPDVESITGLSPAIAIDQKNISKNPRSTVGTITEIYDYLRLLYARIGRPHCPACGNLVMPLSKGQIVERALDLVKAEIKKNPLSPVRFFILAPVVSGKKGEFKELFLNLSKKDILRVRVDGKILALSENFDLEKVKTHTIEAIVDRLVAPREFMKLKLKSMKEKRGFRQAGDFVKRLTEAVESALTLSDGEVIVAFVDDSGFSFPEKPVKMTDYLFSEKLACSKCGIYMERLEPRSFSFNSPYGACVSCSGLGKILKIDESLVLNGDLTILEGGILPFASMITNDTWFLRTLKQMAFENNIDLDKPIKNLDKRAINKILYGTKGTPYEVRGTNRFGRFTSIRSDWEGIIGNLERRYRQTESDYIRHELEKYMREKVCPECGGKRLKSEALSVEIDGISIADLTNFTVSDFWGWVVKLTKDDILSGREKIIAETIIAEIKKRTRFLLDVGLDYLTLGRSAKTLAAGEAQRIRLASQIGSGLSGVLYILDEPSIGLHARDNVRLIKTLRKLTSLKNTVIVVEHDKEMIESADYIFDFGPGAGDMGGKLVSYGKVAEIKSDARSITGKFLAGKKVIPIKKNDREALDIKGGFEKLILKGTREHNLKDIDVEFPLGKFICITGVSGSGKSTLINDVLYHALAKILNKFHRIEPGEFNEIIGTEAIDKVIMIDQSPIGRTLRSNPATYTGVFSYIRELFSNTSQARIRGFKPGRFSFNVKGGRCEACRGEGQVKIEMQFLAPIYVPCEVCRGKRYNQEVLDIYYKEKNISEVLDMTVAAARIFFSKISGLENKLRILEEVGLSYLKLGQPAPTLSGGEAQRMKLAAELGKKATGKTVYLLDEPTTGLHFADLLKLILVIKKLVSFGNTVIVIEHNLDIIKNADYIIDLGPEGGEKGGELVAAGTIEKIMADKNSITGRFLKRYIS